MRKTNLSVTGFVAVIVTAIINVFFCAGCNDAGVESGGGDAVAYLKRFTEKSDGVATFKDERDGQTYKKVKINNQTWMAENLKYVTSSGSWCSEIDGVRDNYGMQILSTSPESKKIQDDCDKYGRLYDWATAMGLDASYNHKKWDGNEAKVQGICPSGWRLPSANDWKKLIAYVGAAPNSADNAYRLITKTGWFDSDGRKIIGVDDLGFSALPGGARRWKDVEADRFYGTWRVMTGHGGYWWTSGSSSKGWNGGAQSAGIDYTTINVWDISEEDDRNYDGMWQSNKMNGLSVRCLQD